MASKKYSFILGLMALTMAAQAQSNKEWKDSSLIPPTRLAQHNEFVNNMYDFPAKPRSQWELGFKVGSPSINGDVAAVFPNFGWGLHVRKSLGYLLSIRGEFNSGSAKGLNWKDANNYAKNPAWAGYQAFVRTPSGQLNSATSVERIFYNHKTKISDLSVQALLSFSNILFHKAENKLNLYGILGVGLAFYDVNVDAKNAAGQKYNFSGIPNGTWDTRKDTRNSLKSLLDGTYETAAEKANSGNSIPTVTTGFGAAFKLSKKVNFAAEYRVSFTQDDLLDGQKWSFAPLGDAAQTPQFDAFTNLSLGLNINIF